MMLARARGFHRCGSAGSNMDGTSSHSSLGRGACALMSEARSVWSWPVGLELSVCPD